jgi:hypothetical protein
MKNHVRRRSKSRKRHMVAGFLDSDSSSKRDYEIRTWKDPMQEGQ